MQILVTIFHVVGKLLAGILPFLHQEWKKPRDVSMRGGDQDARDAIDQNIKDSLEEDSK